MMINVFEFRVFDTAGCWGDICTLGGSFEQAAVRAAESLNQEVHPHGTLEAGYWLTCLKEEPWPSGE